MVEMARSEAQHWVVIGLGMPYDTDIRQEDGEIWIPFVTRESALGAASVVTVRVEHIPSVVRGEVIKQAELPTGG